MTTFNQANFETRFRQNLINNLIKNHQDKLEEHSKEIKVNLLDNKTFDYFSLGTITEIYGDLNLLDDFVEIKLQLLFDIYKGE